MGYKLRYNLKKGKVQEIVYTEEENVKENIEMKESDIRIKTKEIKGLKLEI